MADIIEILKKEDSVMDEILSCQGNIREAVKQRDWLELEKNITKMQSYTVDFICLDDQRDSLKKADFSNEEHELMKIIQSKLIKSKIENTSLSDYVNISHGFVQNVLENVVPQRRNVLYSKNGAIVKKQPQSVVLNKVF
nr:hypothetical protein [uncultured Treponema sp.]